MSLDQWKQWMGILFFSQIDEKAKIIWIGWKIYQKVFITQC